MMLGSAPDGAGETMMPLDAAFFQVGFVVDDIDVAMANWLKEGVGPFFLIRDTKIDFMEYRGQPSDMQFSAAFAQSGHIQIELLSQKNEVPSFYRDSYAAGESGFHHMNRVVKDYDGELARYRARGIEIAGQGRSAGMRFAYADTRASIGMMSEIIEETAELLAFFRIIAEASVDWDGSTPIREIAL